MPRSSFRDRFLTPRVARAVTAPSSILLAGVGASLAIATGLPLVVAPVAGVAAWAARVLLAVPKDEPADRIDPFSIPEPWRAAVVEALKAQVRFDQAVAATEPGPIRTRLEAIGARIDDGVGEVGRIARRGAQLVAARAAVDADDAAKALAKLEQDAAEAAPGSRMERAAEALRAQVATAGRLDALVEDAKAQLLVLDARLDESVARAIELSVRVDDADALVDVGADVDGLVDEMEALRQALEETAHQVPGTGTR
jgi:hypothetical protein